MSSGWRVEWLALSLATIALATMVATGGDAAAQTADETTAGLPAEDDIVFWGGQSDAEVADTLAAVTGIAAASGIVSQVTVGNDLAAVNETNRATIASSFNDSSGLFSVNQSAGEANSQANVRALAILGPGARGLQTQRTFAILELRDNRLEASGSNVAHIDDSFNDTVGIVGVNQAAGHLNQQVNLLALAFGADAGAAYPLAETLLALVGTDDDNELVDSGTTNDARVTNSFNSFAGIAQGSAVAGNLNRVANVLSVSVRVLGAPL